jgi:hypothetical protein
MLLANVGSVCIIGKLAPISEASTNRQSIQFVAFRRSSCPWCARCRRASQCTAAGFPGSVSLTLPSLFPEKHPILQTGCNTVFPFPRASDRVFAGLFTVRLGRTSRRHSGDPARVARSYGVNVIAV